MFQQKRPESPAWNPHPKSSTFELNTDKPWHPLHTEIQGPRPGMFLNENQVWDIDSS